MPGAGRLLIPPSPIPSPEGEEYGRPARRRAYGQYKQSSQSQVSDNQPELSTAGAAKILLRATEQLQYPWCVSDGFGWCVSDVVGFLMLMISCSQAQIYLQLKAKRCRLKRQMRYKQGKIIHQTACLFSHKIIWGKHRLPPNLIPMIQQWQIVQWLMQELMKREREKRRSKSRSRSRIIFTFFNLY